MSQPDFDSRAATWDEDPLKVTRATQIADAIAAQVPLSPRMRALEYGCGTGLVSFALADRLGDMTLTDSARGMLDVVDGKIARAAARADGRSITSARLDLTTDPLPAERFDLIHSAMTLHHVPDTDALLRQFHALLAPGGFLCIADLDAEDGSFHGADVDVHHGFDRAVLSERLQAAGLEVEGFTTAASIARGEDRFSVFLAVARRSA
ncbi:MAG TPA: class I SAM-dependent methyltransferase [Pseudomonadales bacterium]|nr:class I SAM-dependent methyltransferase [Pseudomonadales bacterium]